MPVHSLYKDFFRFLDALEAEGSWEAYSKYYYFPHQAFLESYWRTFHWMDLQQIRSRVEKIKRSDYSILQENLSEIDFENTITSILAQCARVIETPGEPDIYFMVGFFSADGFVFEHQGEPVIGFGLERFKSWRMLPVLFAHEYAHFLRHLFRKDEPYLWDGNDSVKRFLLSEGLAIHFSETVFPEYPLRDHLFFPEERLRWCRHNKSRMGVLLRQILQEKQDPEVLLRGDATLDIPPRIGNYIGYVVIKTYVEHQPTSAYASLLKLRDITDVFDKEICHTSFDG